ncbi:hypothetical protein ONE63_007027 [Megalurothrips usitatus]|uniref:Enoyl reductase (ER) domain-containing protein n=1 Tax=Megalurothrips usitatus TaxID=439358 RepID=A0AAV7XQR0_9NEOP|nr:hypothetical protein ONE63_007027 [Megalurothrips usitatus]
MIMDVLSGFARVQGDKHSGAPLTMRDVHLFSLVENPSTGARQLTISFLASSGRFEMTDCSGRLVMSGRVRLLDEDDDKVAAPASRQGQGLQARQGAEPGRTLTGAALYDELRASGMSYSPRLQTLQRFSLGPHEWVAETPPHLPAQLTSSLQLMQLASLTDDNTVTFPAVIGRLDVLSGRGDGRLRFDRDTGFVESAWLRLEAVEMRPLTAGDGLTADVARGKKRHLHGSAKHWQSPESLQVKVTSVQTEEAETRPGLSAQLCGLSGEVFAEGFAGQRVMAVGLRGADERVRVDASLAWPVPHGWTDKQAAAAPLPYCKAEYALRVMARALAGESALVHDAASPLGQAAVRVALGLGCTPVFVTVRSAEERQRVLGLFPELPPQDVLMLWSFEWQLRARRRSAGVDVAIGTVSGEAFKASLRCMAFWGRYVHCASQKHPRTATMGMSKFLESLSLIGVSEDYLLLAGPETRLLLAEAVLEGVHNGTVQPIVGDGGEAAFLSTESACPSVCAMSMESVYDSGYTSPSDSVADLKSPSNSVVDLKSPSASTTDLKSPSASTTDLRPSYVSQSEEEADKRVPADVGARLLSYLPAALSSASAGADGVRLRRVPSRYGAPSSGAPTEVPAEPREVFPLLAFPPLGLPLDQRGAASLRELASRLMMPVFVVEVPGRTAGGVAGQARAVLDTLRAGGPGRGRGPYNLLGWGPSAPLALEVAHQLDAPACTFLLDGDVRTVQSWASAVAASPGGKLGALEPLRPMLRDLGALVVGPGQRHGVATSGHTDATPTAMKGGRTVVLRGSSKEASSLEGQENVEVHTVQSARLDSDEVAAQINGGAAWSRMLPEAALRQLRDSAL